MRTESAYSIKGSKDKGKQKVPREGSRIRLLWDLLHLHQGEVVTLPLTTMFPITTIYVLRDFYGLDIINLSTNEGDKAGRKKGNSRWILAGEWFGSKYVDYIAKNKQRLAKVEKEIT